MFSRSLLNQLAAKFNQVLSYLNNTNIAAAVSEMENVGSLATQYSQKRADDIYALIDRTWNVVCKVENRVPAEYDKFRRAVTALLLSVMGDYLIANDAAFNKMTVDSRHVIAYAERRDRYAFTLAKDLGAQMRNYSYKDGADYLYYVESLAYDGTNFQRLIALTREYCGSTMKKAASDLMNSL